MQSTLHELDTEKIKNDAFFIDDMLLLKHNISINQFKRKSDSFLSTFKAYFKAAEDFEISSFEFITSTITNPILAVYGGKLIYLHMLIKYYLSFS